MTLTGEQVSVMFMNVIQKHGMRSPRAQQQAEHRIGASEIGLCRSYLKFMTQGAPYDERDGDVRLPAFVGTAVGDLVEKAYKEEHPGAIIQSSFDCELPSGKVIPCHADIIDPDLNLLIDVKTKSGLSLVAAQSEPTRQYRYQVAIYLRGAIQSGLLKDGARAVLVYIDRSGDDPVPVVQEVTVDDATYAEIDDWIDDANYAVLHNVEAPQDQPYDFCANYCNFFTACRGNESLAEGLIEDEDAKLALKVHLQAKADKADAEKRKKDADAALRPYAARGGYIVADDGPYELSETIIGASSYTVDRKESVRMNVRKKKVKK